MKKRKFAITVDSDGTVGIGSVPKEDNNLIFTYKDENTLVMSGDSTFYNIDVPSTKLEIKKNG